MRCLQGGGEQFGGSVGDGLSVGIDRFMTEKDAFGHKYSGVALNVGVGAGADVHYMRTQTELINQDEYGNVPNIIDIPRIYDILIKTYDDALIAAIDKERKHV